MRVYRAVPFVTIVRNPGKFGLTITLVSGPTARIVNR
jgi:hypothetical protein